MRPGSNMQSKPGPIIFYYYPMVNLKFWNSLPPDLQKIFLEVWNEVVPKQREIAETGTTKGQRIPAK